MHMAAGLFAGVVPNKNASTAQKRPIMQSGNDSNVSSALDDLIPVSNTSGLAPVADASATSHNSVFDNDLGTSSMPSSSDLFGMGPMGTGSLPPPPSMAPPPPPSEPPPPPPPEAAAQTATAMPAPAQMSPPTMPPPATAPPTMPNNMLGGNPSIEQMQEMIKQQQAQMQQMQMMMQQMQMQGGGAAPNNMNGNGPMGGGWPPSS